MIRHKHSSFHYTYVIVAFLLLQLLYYYINIPLMNLLILNETSGVCSCVNVTGIDISQSYFR